MDSRARSLPWKRAGRSLWRPESMEGKGGAMQPCFCKEADEVLLLPSASKRTELLEIQKKTL